MTTTRLAALVCFLATVALAPSAGAAAQTDTGRFVNRSALWQRTGKNLLWGFRDMYNLRVLHEPGKPYPYVGWFFGWTVEDCNRTIPGFAACDAIFAARARSLDGPWEVWSGEGVWDATMSPRLWRPVVSAQHAYYDQWHNGDPSVVKVGKRYYMAYSSTGFNKDGIPQGQPGDKDGDICCVMGAVSEDGVHWQRSPAPILLHQEDFGAAPVPNDFVHLYGSYHRPSLLREGGKWRLWFDYRTPTTLAMGYAENSGDFLKPGDWKVLRAGQNPCIENWPNPNVVRVGPLLYAYADPGGYKPAGWPSRKIAEAVSRDGVAWTILGYVEPDADTPATQIPEAYVRREGGRTWMYVFYACQIGGEPYDWRYDRIRYMRREIRPEELRRHGGPQAKR